MDFIGKRFYAFFGGHNVAVAMHVAPSRVEASADASTLYLALSLCTNRDQFDKRTARNILNGRLDDALTGGSPKWVYSLDYNGTYPKKEVMCRIMDTVRTFLPGMNRRRSYEHVQLVNREISRILSHV